eukprot:scaffold23410_cov17-Tisochrysis_lutea.AAC.1
MPCMSHTSTCQQLCLQAMKQHDKGFVRNEGVRNHKGQMKRGYARRTLDDTQRPPNGAACQNGVHTDSNNAGNDGCPQMQHPWPGSAVQEHATDASEKMEQGDQGMQVLKKPASAITKHR